MQVALVKFATQSCIEPCGATTDFVNTVSLTVFDKSFNVHHQFIKFPSLTPSPQNVEIECEKSSGNKLIQIATKKLQAELKKSTLIFVGTKREKELILEFTENTSKNIVVLT